MRIKEFLERVSEARLVAVIRADHPDTALDRARQARDAGVEVLEVAWTTPKARDVLEHLSEWPTVVGAGTITSPREAMSALRSGAEFLIAPSFSEAVHEEALKHDVAYVPGVFTPQDVSRALSAGCRVLKLFPAVTGGTVHLSALREPFPGLSWIPTGGVTWETAAEWIAAGATAVAMGTALFRTADTIEAVASLRGVRP